jgi:hypothetical protein
VILLIAAPIDAVPISILSGLTPTYRVDFASGTPLPTLDTNGLGQLKTGDTGVPGSSPVWVFDATGLTLSVRQPLGVPAVAGLGVFATPVSFAAGDVFGMRARFAAPVGPHDAGNSWAVALFARTGGEDLLPTDTNASATLQVRGSGARLNTPGSSTPANLPNVPQSLYDLLFSSDSGPDAVATFTLEMLVDRAAGHGEAALHVNDFEVTKTFTFAEFLPTSGPTITAIGPALAISNAPGRSASVRVLEFEVLTVPEPGGLALAAIGMVACLLLRRGLSAAQERGLRCPRVVQSPSRSMVSAADASSARHRPTQRRD